MAGINELQSSCAEMTQIKTIRKQAFVSEENSQSRSVKFETYQQKPEKLKTEKQKRESRNLSTET